MFVVRDIRGTVSMFGEGTLLADVISYLHANTGRPFGRSLPLPPLSMITGFCKIR